MLTATDLWDQIQIARGADFDVGCLHHNRQYLYEQTVQRWLNRGWFYPLQRLLVVTERESFIRPLCILFFSVRAGNLCSPPEISKPPRQMGQKPLCLQLQYLIQAEGLTNPCIFVIEFRGERIQVT